MVQIIQAGPTAQAIQNQRFERDIQGIAQGVGGLVDAGNERQRKRDLTRRQRALQAAGQLGQAAQSGVVLAPEQQQQFIEETQSGAPGAGFQSLFSAQADQAQRDRQRKAEDRDLNRQAKEVSIRQKEAEIGELGKPIEETREFQKVVKFAQARAKIAGKKNDKGKQLSAKDVSNFNEGNQIPTMLTDIESTIDANAGDFGPIEGRLRSANPFDTRAQTIDAQMRASSQAFGRFMEGGVLRKEDEEKYKKMFPQLSDTPQVAKNKLRIVQRLLGQKQESLLGALKSSGFDTRGIEQNVPIPDAPADIAGVAPAPTGINPFAAQEAQAAPAPTQHPQASEAFTWAQNNPGDPRAQAILERLGAR